MNSKRFSVLVLAVGLLSVVPMFAHHAQTLYDRESSVTVEGTVTKMEWTNPHIFLFFDVKGANGSVENWGTEFSSPVTLRRNYGWSKDTFKPGDRITVTGNPRKDGTRMLWGQRGGDQGVPGIKKLN